MEKREAEEKIAELMEAMFAFDHGDTRRIQHFLKVWGFARTIGIREGLEDHTQFILESAAIVHDIGIHACEEKYGSCPGNLQEVEGPPLARELLAQLGYSEEDRERIAWLVSRHHTYTNVEGMDYQILLEADFLVNSYENESSPDTVRNFCRRVFCTESGKRLLQEEWGITLA